MSKDAKIAAATGVSVGGRRDASVAVENAMVKAALAGHAAGQKDEDMKAAMLKARHDAKPEARR